MAAVNVKQEVHRVSPGQSNMAADSVDGMDKLGEKSFSAMQGLIMAEDRRMKEKEVNSLQNLMEYREAPASPSASSVTTTLSQENCGSPSTPNSPPRQPDVQDMDDERLPNELLEELCEDIGMKEGMELDFVEFLMEQDVVDPQTYMTPEGLRSSGFATPIASQTNSAVHTPTNKNSHEGTWGGRNCGSPSYSIASSTNVTIATSSGSSSPVSKRFHLSNSGPSSPVRTNPPPLTHLGPHNSHVFKAPQTPPTPRRPIPTSQGAASPRSNLSVSSNHSNQSDHSSHSNVSNHSNHSSVNSNQNSNQIPQRCFSPKTTGGAPSPQLPHSTTGTYNKPPPQYGQLQGQGQIDLTRPQNSNNLQKAAPMTNNQPYQRLGRPVPPNVNVQNFPQQNQKWMSASQSQGTIGNQSCAVNSMQGQMPNSQCVRPADASLDQGYFTSSDSMSVRSFGSSAASTVPSNMSNSMQTLNSQKQMPMGANTQVQKSVHFADNMNMHNSTPTEGLPYEPLYRTNVPDCELEEYQNSIRRRMQSKMMPRLNHHVKPDIGPYTVPNNNGQAPMSPYDFSSAHSSNMNMNSPATNMQQFDFSQKSNNDGFGMDNNQNLVMQNYNENMPSSQGQVNNMNCQMQSSCNGPMGMQQQMDPFRGPCQIQDPSKGNMYDPAGMQNMCKTNNQALQNDGNNCQFSGQSQGNLNSGMMGMNQGMMGNQGEVSHTQQTYNNSQNFQGMPNSQDFPPQPNMMGGNGEQRQMHMNVSSAQGNSRMMGYDPQFEQTRAMSGNMNNMNNMDNSVYPANQGQGMVDNMNWNGGLPQTPQQPHQMGATPRSAPMAMPGPGMSMGGGQCGQLSGVPCVIPNCVNCKNGSPNRPPMMASQQRFIQHLITDRSNAFRSHPLFPLLRDLIIADMNFSTPNFPYQLISNLPADFDKLLQNFLHRNPPAGNYQTNYAVESVIMDALKYAHHCLIDKIRQKQDQDVDKHSKSTSKSLSAIEEFCEKFDQSVRKSYIKPATLQVGGNPGNNGMGGPQMGPMGPPEMGTPTKDLKFSMGMGNMMMPGGPFGSPMAKKGLEFHHGMMSPNFKQFVDIDNMSDCASIVSSSSHGNKPESKKHPSLPKEAVAIMLDWLRQHKDNPYPNDDEKAMLIKQTGLTINQINYWFTNARRRILPKWAQQCK